MKKKNEGSFMIQKDNEDVDVFFTPTDVNETTPRSKPAITSMSTTNVFKNVSLN